MPFLQSIYFFTANCVSRHSTQRTPIIEKFEEMETVHGEVCHIRNPGDVGSD